MSNEYWLAFHGNVTAKQNKDHSYIKVIGCTADERQLAKLGNVNVTSYVMLNTNPQLP